MRAHVSEPLALEEMAEIAALSPFHFHRIFRAITGIPPGEFLAVLRLDAAKRLLLTTSLRVTDVCFDLGYASLGTFASRFKQLVGLSPLQLRQLADEVAAPSPEGVSNRRHGAREPGASGGICGTIARPGAPTAGPIFVGLFPRPIPQGRPVACMTLTAPGPFQLGPSPDGHYYLLAAALPWSPSALTYLLPDAGLLVGGAERPVLVGGGRAAGGPLELTLRSRRATDPPMLGVFPPLLATRAAAGVLKAV